MICRSHLEDYVSTLSPQTLRMRHTDLVFEVGFWLSPVLKPQFTYSQEVAHRNHPYGRFILVKHWQVSDFVFPHQQIGFHYSG
jgi:hypothetical protein